MKISKTPLIKNFWESRTLFIKRVLAAGASMLLDPLARHGCFLRRRLHLKYQRGCTCHVPAGGFFFLVVLLALAAADGTIPKEMSVLLPGAVELNGWEPSGSPQYAAGEDLFLLINGGAEVYHEYGFRDAVLQSFRSAGGKAFNLEIYRMADTDAAYGVYTFKTGDSGTVLDLGDGGLLEDYYLNFRKGVFLVTVTGLDSEAETMTGIRLAAKVIAGKITGKGEPPALVGLLPRDPRWGLKPHSIKYIEGPLGLFNIHNFGGAVFGVKQGVVADYRDFRLFIFKYSTEAESTEQYNAVRGVVEKREKLVMMRKNEYIFLVSGLDPEKAKEVIPVPLFSPGEE